ncbi:MAG: dihydroorotate dehydrogenase [Gammaproteobacteria bacterium]|nr:dihydroorotate dehydrogenase [Gammaproteobacteria bacterium]
MNDKQNLNTDLKTDLKTEFCGMQFNTPLVLLSGCVGFGEEYTRVEGFSNRDVGAVCLKGTTLEKRLGNAPHRVCETPMGMLNSIGLQNPGTRYVIDKILPELDFDETRFIANVSGSTIEEYRKVTEIFNDSPIDAIEINISCPNVKEGGVVFGNDPAMSARVVEACRAVTDKPLITKLSPNQTNIADNAQRCIDAGTDAFAVINTLMGMVVDIEERTAILGNTQGGLSGPAIKPIALLKVHQVYQVCREHNIPIIGQGGIVTAEDALEFIIAGASAVGIGTALFYDPLVCVKVNSGISEYLARHNLTEVSQLVGSLVN